MTEHHSHLTRDIKPEGQCPACDAGRRRRQDKAAQQDTADPRRKD